MSEASHLAAIDDCEFIYVPVPDSDGPNRNSVYLRNRNPTKSVIATVTVTGPDNFEVTTFSGTSTRPFLPQEFEVRIPQGGTKYIGVDLIEKRDAVGPGPDIKRPIASLYNLSGARYVADEPDPQPPEPRDVDSILFRYTVRYQGAARRFQVFAVNVSRLWGVDITFRSTEETDINTSIPPSETKLIYDSGANIDTPDVLHITRARFYVHQPDRSTYEA